jgi:hypothetical protein
MLLHDQRFCSIELASVGLLLSLALGAAAQESKDNTTIVEFMLRPAAEPRPSLKYRLLPTVHERKPGNAATHYYRAILLQRQLPKEYWQQSSDNFKAWNESPRDSYPKEEVAKWLDQQSNVLAELKEAAYKEHCDWEFRLQDIQGPKLFSFLLPEIQQCRELARTLRIKARYEIFDGRYDDAFETLRCGYQLARDTAQPPLIVAGLVGVAITGVMNAELEHLIQDSDQNYYWAIAGLTRPPIDLRASLEFEMNAPFQVFRFLRDAETSSRSADEWRALVLGGLRELTELGGPHQFHSWQGELAAVGLIAKLYPVSKQALVAGGMNREQVEAMPVGQVVAIHTARATEAAYHDIFKLSLLPYDQAMARLPDMLKSLEKGSIGPEAGLSGVTGLPIASLFLPAVQSVLHAEVRASRNLAALQTLEAIRMHVALSGNKLPASLADITTVAVPKNPVNDQPFPYQLDPAGEFATLDMPALDGHSRQDGKRYLLRLRK